MQQGTTLRGRNVYGSGSYAPTKGRVSAAGSQGYLKRSIRQQINPVRSVGGDGQSDTRSGLAAAAMQRRIAQQPKNNGFHVASTTPFPTAQQPQPVNPNGQAVGGGAQSGAAANSMGGTPQVVVNNNGQLELPYSPAWSQELLTQMGQYNSDLAALQADQQQSNLQFAAQRRLTDTEYTDTKRTTRNRNGGAGTLFSSAYGVQSLDDANDYQNTINELTAQQSASETAYDTQRTAIINGFKSILQQQALQYAESVAENAGSLGYGQESAEPHRNRNASAYKNRNKKKKWREK